MDYQSKLRVAKLACEFYNNEMIDQINNRWPYIAK